MEKTKLYVFEEQSIGYIKGKHYSALSGLGSKGWSPLDAPKMVKGRSIRPANKQDLETFRLAPSEYYLLEEADQPIS